MKIHQLKKYKQQSNSIACLTAYDASFAQILTQANIEIILVGDSLAMSVCGFDNTLKASMKTMLYHVENVARGIKKANNEQKPLLIADMPWGSYAFAKKALKNAMRFVKKGADIVKLEGANQNIFEAIQLIRANGIPICAHLGLLPQSINLTGGFFRQGENQNSADQIYAQALKLDSLGVELMVLECIPDYLAEKISQNIKATTIGIGTYSPCDGQVLVIYDLLGLSAYSPKFSKNFLIETADIKKAVISYIKAVKDKQFPQKLSKD